MTLLRRRALPVEQRPGPLRGFKLAYPLLSAQGREVAFSGLTIGGQQAYGARAEASCVWTGRHRCPNRRCGCGFYCLHSAQDAWAVACDTRYRGAAMIEVAAAGRYIRYERGLRYARQRVRAVHVGRCRCGRLAELLVDAGAGQVGWRRLAGSCARCAGWRPAVTFAEFATRSGAPMTVRADERAPAPPAPSVASPLHHAPPVGPATDGVPDVVVLTAEVALLQARLDNVQAALARLSGHRSG